MAQWQPRDTFVLEILSLLVKPNMISKLPHYWLKTTNIKYGWQLSLLLMTN